jgi:hypothetical protein
MLLRTVSAFTGSWLFWLDYIIIFCTGIVLTASAISFRFIVFSNTTLRISRRYWLLAHTALIVALATVYCAFILLEQTNFLLSQIIPTVVEYWKPGNVALVMWGANVWTADGFTVRIIVFIGAQYS